MPKIDLIATHESFTIGDEEHSYTLRRVPQEMVAEIRKRHTTRVERAGGPPRGEIDHDAINQDMLDYAIQSWTGICGPGGTEAPCTAANKAALPNAEKFRIIAALGAVNLQAETGADLKNLSGPSATPGPEGGLTPAASTPRT
jgi:hypothetical protein